MCVLFSWIPQEHWEPAFYEASFAFVCLCLLCLSETERLWDICTVLLLRVLSSHNILSYLISRFVSTVLFLRACSLHHMPRLT